MAISFAADIRPLLTDTDIDHMAFFCDLSKYEDVKANVDGITQRLHGEGPVMPPASAGGPWSAEKIALFDTWITDGCQP